MLVCNHNFDPSSPDTYIWAQLLKTLYLKLDKVLQISKWHPHSQQSLKVFGESAQKYPFDTIYQ